MRQSLVSCVIESLTSLSAPRRLNEKEPGRRLMEATPAPRVGPSEGAARPDNDDLNHDEQIHDKPDVHGEGSSSERTGASYRSKNSRADRSETSRHHTFLLILFSLRHGPRAVH